MNRKTNNLCADDFWHDGWTPEQYGFSMRAAYTERRAHGIAAPHVVYADALDWHRRHKLGALSVGPL